MSELNDMTCAQMGDVAAELALGVLTGRERAMAVAHLDMCEACREDVRHLMATGEQLLELLPPAEPPAGFETRVLERLGLPASAQGRAEPLSPRRVARGTHRKPGRRGAGSGADRSSAARARPGGTGRPGRMRRALAAAGVAVAVIAAGLGGWRIGAGTAPASSASAQLTSASLLTANRQSVGTVFLYSGEPRWLYMSVDMGNGDESVTCQLVSASGQVTTVGTFQLADGYGAWASPDPGVVGNVTGARLVSASGAVLATATLHGA